MFVQTQKTPNPNSLKFLPNKKVSNDGLIEITDKSTSNNELVRNILSINGVAGIFLAEDFLTVNKEDQIDWDDLKEATYWTKDINKGPGIGIYTEENWYTKENLS